MNQGNGRAATASQNASTPTTLKVAHLSSAHYMWDARILEKECRSLAKAGHDVTFVVPHERDTISNGVKIKGVCKPKNTASMLDRWIGPVRQIYSIAAHLQADVYHFHDPELIPLGFWLSLRGKRVIYDAHEDFARSFRYKYYIPAFARTTLGWLAGKIEKFAAKRFTGVIAATPTIAKQFNTRKGNVTVVRNFPRLEEFTRGPGLPWNERPPLVAYVGSIVPERGYRETITAMSLVPARMNAQFAIGGPLISARREEMSRLPGFNRCVLLGTLGRREVTELLGRARVGLVLLHPTPNLISALPVKLFEYMAAGIPVVASDFPLLREIVEGSGCGMLVDPLDVRAIAHAIEHLLSQSDEARRMGERGRAAVESRYNWSTEEQRLLSFYSRTFCAASQPRDPYERRWRA